MTDYARLKRSDPKTATGRVRRRTVSGSECQRLFRVMGAITKKIRTFELRLTELRDHLRRAELAHTEAERIYDEETNTKGF